MINWFFVFGFVSGAIFTVGLLIAAVCYIGGQYNQIDAELRGKK